MADVIPKAVFQMTLSHAEYSLVTMGLAMVGGAPLKPVGDQRRDAAILNRQLLAVEATYLNQRMEVVTKKLEKADAAVAAVDACEYCGSTLHPCNCGGGVR